MSTPRPVTFAAGALARSSGSYKGFSLREIGGAVPAIIRLWDSSSAASGQLLETIVLAVGTDKRGPWPDGVYFVNGIFAEVVAGAVEGIIAIA